MATTKNKNLFYQLYSRSNDVTNSGYVCQTAIDENDTSFDISGSEGQITDSNGDILSSIDLSGIHVDGLTQYNTETKILQPNCAYIIQGPEHGETYKAQFFLISPTLSCVAGYEDYCNLQFDITYVVNNKKHAVHVDNYKIRKTYGSFIQLTQKQLDWLKAPITVSIRKFNDELSYNNELHYICFQSTQQGYEFLIRNVILTPIKKSDETYDGVAGEFCDSPFGDIEVTTNDILDALDEIQPVKKDEDEPENYSINCDIFRELLNIGFDLNLDFEEFCKMLDILKKYFARLFDEDGNCINWELLNEYKERYKKVYDIFFSQILMLYNIHDIIKILEMLKLKIMSLKERLGPYFCLEDLNRQILSVKYPNGAMRGIVLIPDWAPLDEYAEQRVLLVNHIADKVEVAVPVNKEKLKTYLGVDKLGHFTARLYEKAMATVKINALLQDERQNYLTDYSNLPLNDISSSEGFSPSVDPTWESAFDTNNFVDNDFHRNPYDDLDNPVPQQMNGDSIWENALNQNPNIHFFDTYDMLSHKTIGLYKYMEYLTKNDIWLRVGDAYMIFGRPDNFESDTKNLLSSVLIYNPNSVPIRIKYMIMV